MTTTEVIARTICFTEASHCQGCGSECDRERKCTAEEPPTLKLARLLEKALEDAGYYIARA